ncbi:hypothetical protein [Kitasatospora cineracea]|uniref:hypothetical protein n=1 Tax=Kitasatospora cineracea TaxID=88074 RepID=UPI0033EEEEC0
MSKPYPVVVQRPLAEPRKRDRFGLLPRRREAHELPTVSAHEVMVYRVDGKYHLDTGQRRLSDQQVVEASHVSVVDLRRNTPVTVTLAIPSAEASEFEVVVTFVCTVTDPVEIVEEGLTDAALALRAYLRSHRRFFELGLDHRLKDLNTVRRNVSAQVMAYTIERPLKARGMTAELESVQVRTPEVLSDFEQQRRTQEFDLTLAFEQQRNHHTLNSQRQQYTQDLDDRDREHRHGALTADQANQLLLELERREFELRAARLTKDQVGDSPIAAAHYAHAAGGLDSAELMRILQQDLDNQRAVQRLREARDADVRLEVLRSLIQEGHTANLNINVATLLQEVVGQQTPHTDLAASDAPEISPSGSWATADPGEGAPDGLDDSIKGLREEDDY